MRGQIPAETSGLYHLAVTPIPSGEASDYRYHYACEDDHDPCPASDDDGNSRQSHTIPPSTAELNYHMNEVDRRIRELEADIRRVKCSRKSSSGAISSTAKAPPDRRVDPSSEETRTSTRELDPP